MDFLNDWLEHPNYWFHQNNDIDNYLTKNYEYLFDYEWDNSIDNIKYHLTFIIIYDQLCRHIYRNQLANHIISYYLQKALIIHKFIEDNYNIYDKFSGIEWMFWGLPIRHSNCKFSIMSLMQKTWNKLKTTNNDNCIKYLKKFLIASYQRIPISQHNLIEYFPNKIKGTLEYISVFNPILDFYTNEFNYNKKLIIDNYFKLFIEKYKINKFILSLSGGVDSMLCSFIMKRMNINFCAVYIDYCNRKDDEANFVISWCKFIQIPLYVRSIREIQREPSKIFNLRNIYESYTRNVRYQCYKDIWNEMGELNEPYVILGHNQDDCFENILTNICHQHKYENLEGMTQLMNLEGIYFCRPILSVSKSLIYKEARLIGIPYLKDSTPLCCQRGQIRDSVRPTINKWDNRFIPSMFQLSNIMKENDIFKQMLVNKWNTQTNKNYDCYTLSLTYEDISIITSSTLWKSYLLSIGITITQKSLKNFIECLSRNISKKQNLNCVLNKLYSIQYKYNKNIFIILSNILFSSHLQPSLI